MFDMLKQLFELLSNAQFIEIDRQDLDTIGKELDKAETMFTRAFARKLFTGAKTIVIMVNEED